MKTQVTQLKYMQKPKLLHVTFENSESFTFPSEFLRANSPSAEHKGHLAKDFANINIIGIDPVGEYAVKLIFDDGHHSGIYSWDWLYELGKNYDSYNSGEGRVKRSMTRTTISAGSE